MRLVHYIVGFSLAVFLAVDVHSQCKYVVQVSSAVNSMEANGRVTKLNLNGQISIFTDSIVIRQEVLGQVVQYRFKIMQTECGAWDVTTKNGLIVFIVQQVGADKPYEGKIILEKTGKIKVVTLLDSKEGKYQINYEDAQIKEL